MSLIRKHVAVLQAWACLALVHKRNFMRLIIRVGSKYRNMCFKYGSRITVH